VEATVHARGLPKSPSGEIQAHGMLDGAPLNLDAALERSATTHFGCWCVEPTGKVRTWTAI